VPADELPQVKRRAKKAPTFPVVTTRIERPFSVPDAMRMIRDGYSLDQVSKVTGYPRRFLETRRRFYAA